MKKILSPTRFTLLLFAALLLGAHACKKSTGIEAPPPPTTEDILRAPDGYNYNTEKRITINVQLQSSSGAALRGVLVNIYNTFAEDGGYVIYNGITDASGRLTGTVEVPAYLETVVVDPAYVGVLRNAKVAIQGNAITATLGGPQGYAGNVLPNQLSQMELGLMSSHAISQFSVPPFKFLGEFDDAGRPKYLEATDDKIDAGLLEYINASLPERKPVPTFHPEYLNQNAATNLNIIELSDVWVTFIHEGAGYLNTLFFYTYPTGKSPKKIEDIKEISIILPNASLSGSGGSLKPGNKVKLGRFEAGTTVSFGIIANGWSTSAKKVTNGTHILFADDALNPGSKPETKRQTVLLYDESRKLFLTGFEDIQRENSGCDHDFNDLVFYSTSNPVTAISTENVNPIDKPVDSDKDGVSDVYDKFPNDPERAYIRYFPSENVYGTLAFEDLWPSTGDYDMNDLVVEYRYAIVSNALNRAIEMEANYRVAAAGAAFANGFGVELPIASHQVKSVTGALHTGNVSLKMNGNGTESGHSKAVIIPFDNAFNMLKVSGGPVNTFAGVARRESQLLEMKITFSSALDNSLFPSMIFNPFVIANKVRGAEIHLPGYTPTALADVSLFRTKADDTQPGINKYYKTKDNMPFGLSFIEKFDYPIEKANIRKAFRHYDAWVKSAGAAYKDWYSSKETGYREDSQIMK